MVAATRSPPPFASPPSAAGVETLAGQYWHATAIGQPAVLEHAELDRVRARFAGCGQPTKRR